MLEMRKQFVIHHIVSLTIINSPGGSEWQKPPGNKQIKYNMAKHR